MSVPHASTAAVQTDTGKVSGDPVIRLIGVEKTFSGQPVLRGLNLDIPRGKLTTIIGRSGGGKSVLLKHLIGLLKPDRGQVLVDDVDITTLGAHQLNEVRKKFAMLFQGAALFDSLSVFENVAFPLREKTALSETEIEQKVRAMLEEVGLPDMGHKFPAELSGAMRKRAGLARARKPRAARQVRRAAPGELGGQGATGAFFAVSWLFVGSYPRGYGRRPGYGLKSL